MRVRGISGTSRDGGLRYYYRNDANNLSVGAPAIEKEVIDSLRMFEKNEKMVAYANEIKKDTGSRIAFVSQRLQQMEKELVELDEKERNLFTEFKSNGQAIDRVNKWFEARLKEIDESRGALNEKLAGLRKEQERLADKYTDASSLKKSLKVVFDRLEKAEPSFQRGLLRQLFKKITVHKDNKVKLEWNIPVCDTGGQVVFHGVGMGG